MLPKLVCNLFPCHPEAITEENRVRLLFHGHSYKQVATPEDGCSGVRRKIGYVTGAGVAKVVLSWRHPEVEMADKVPDLLPS